MTNNIKAVWETAPFHVSVSANDHVGVIFSVPKSRHGIKGCCIFHQLLKKKTELSHFSFHYKIASMLFQSFQDDVIAWL